MTTENTSTPLRDIPVPPSGGSWTWNDAAWKWVSNDPVTAGADAGVANIQPITYTIEQEQ